MKILIIATRPPYPPDDGIAIPVYELTRALHARHEVTLAVFARDPAGATEALNHLHRVAASVALLPMQPLARYLLPPAWPHLAAGVPLSTFPYTAAAAAAAVARLARDADGIVAHLVHSAAVVPEARRPSACLIAQDVVHTQIEQNLRFVRAPARRLYYALDARLMRRYERGRYQEFGVCLVVSEAERRRVLALDPSIPAVVTPNGVDTEYFAPSATEGGSAVVYLGALSGHRNEEAAWILAHEIFPVLRQRVAGLVLHIVGKNPSARLRDLAAADPAIRVSGTVDDIRPFLRPGSVFVSPQVVGTGIKNSVLQALALGVPAVVSPASVEGIDGVPGRDYLVCRSLEQFVEAVVRVLQDRAVRDALGAHGRRLAVERYSWARYAAVVEEALATLPARRGHP